MTIAIESDPPLPKRARNAKLYPFDKLEVGQSFAVSAEKRNSIFALAVRHSKDGKKFTGRTADGKIRIWRTK